MSLITICIEIQKCVLYVPMPTHCTITCFGFHAVWIDGIRVVYFQFMHLLGRPCYVRGCVSVFVYRMKWGEDDYICFCNVSVLCLEWWWREGRRWNPLPQACSQRWTRTGIARSGVISARRSVNRSILR